MFILDLMALFNGPLGVLDMVGVDESGYSLVSPDR